MLITMLADRFLAGGVLCAKGTQVDVATEQALRWIGENVAAAVGASRETAQGIRKDVPVLQDRISGTQVAGDSPVSGDGTPQGATVAAIPSAQKVLTDGVTAKTGPGTQLRQPDGTNAYMVATSGYGATPKACTVTWAAGNVVTITVPSGHGCVEQDVFVTQAATLPGDAAWARVLRVASVVDATNITARLPFTPSSGPSGAITFQRCARNVSVDLDLDYNYAGNNTAGANPNRMAAILAFVADSAGTLRGKEVFKYLGSISGADNCQFKIASYPNSRSDTAKLYGPANNVTLSGFGQATEDCVSIQALEPAAFIGYMPSQGNITNTKLLNWSARCTSTASGAICVYADPTYVISGTVIEKCEAWALAGTADGLSVRKGAGFNPTAANLPDLTLRDSEFFSAGGDCIALRTPGGRLTMENVTIRTPGSTSQRGLYVSEAWDCIEVVGSQWQVENWTPVAGRAFVHVNNVGIKTMRFSGCRFRGAAGATALRMFLLDGAAGQISYLEFNNCDIADMDNFFRVDTTALSAPTVVVNGGTITNVLTPFNFRKTGGKLILNGPTINGATNGVCRSEGASVVTDVYGFANLTTPSQLATGINGGRVNIKGVEMPVDLAAATLPLNVAAQSMFSALATTGIIPAGAVVVTRPLTFTGTVTAATSATLTANFSGPTGAYPVFFSDASVRLVTLTNGAATATWTGAVASATASAAFAEAV